MADLNISKSESSSVSENCGQNLVDNGNFEFIPTFVAATTTSAKFIDGTAAGSSIDLGYRWFFTKSGTGQAFFDTSISHNGSASLKVSTTGIGSFIEVKYIGPGYFQAKDIRLLGNTVYTLIFWMKTNYVSGDSLSGAWVDFLESDNSGATVSHETGSSPVKITQDWTKYTLTFTTTSTTAWGHPELRIYGHNGTGTLIMDAWFDDITIVAPSVNDVLVSVGPIVTNPIQVISGPKIWS